MPRRGLNQREKLHKTWELRQRSIVHCARDR
jgi:hypothetical protein